MRLDPRTKILILAVTSVSVFMNKSIAVECVLAGIPLVLLSTSGNLKRTLKYAAFFLASADPAFYRTEAARDFRRNRLYVCSVYPQASPLFYAGRLSDCNDKRK